jgi:hypothetical protein
MDIEFIIYILLILVILNLAFTFYVYCQKATINLEGFDVNAEALENLAKVLDSGNMSVTNLTVTSDLEVKGKAKGKLNVENLEVTGGTKTKDLNLDGIHIRKHPSRSYLKIPYPVEINDAIDGKRNEPYPGIIVGNVITTTAPGGSFWSATNYGANVLRQMPYLPNGSRVSELGLQYVFGGEGGAQNYSVKKMVTPGYGTYHGYYTQGGWSEQGWLP